MGASHSAQLFEEQASTAEPGTKSIISESLENLDPPPTEHEIVEEFLRIVRYPVDSTTEAVLKQVDVQEKSPDDFIVKVILDGKKLDGYSKGRGDGIDRVKTWKRVLVDRTKHVITAEDFVDEGQLGAWADEASDKEVVCKTSLHLLSDPLRLEFLLDKDGQRLAIAPVRDALYVWSDAIINGIHSTKTAKAQVTADAPSIKDKDAKSNVSDPLEAHVSYDNFFLYLVAVMKEDFSKVPGAEASEVSATEFVVELKLEEDSTQRRVLKLDAEKGETQVEVFLDGKLARTQYNVVHRSPLVVESWGIDHEGSRVTGASAARELQSWANRAIDKANSWFG